MSASFARVAVVAAALVSMLTAVGCDRRARREWNANDHDREQSAPAGRVSASADPNDPRALIETAWRSQCAICHGLLGKGDGPNGAMNHAPDLTEPALLDARTDDQLIAVIRGGRGKMPAFPAMPEPIVKGIVMRIRALRGR